MILPRQHTEPGRWTRAVIGLAVFALAAGFGALSGREAVAQHVEVPGRSAAAGAGTTLPLGDVVVTSTDETVIVPRIPNRAIPDSLTTDGIRLLTSNILELMTEEGRLMAVARVDSLRPGSSGAGWDVYISIDPGPIVPLSGVHLLGDEDTRPRTAAFLAGIRVGETAGRSSPEDVRTSLRGSGLFRFVGEPYYEILADSTARLTIPVSPAPPGSFDISIGVLPGSDPGGGPQLVGNGSIDLNNAFGSGRRFDLLLDRRSGRTSHLNAGASDPFVAGYPVRLDLRFDGLQQDSTWSTRSWSVAAAYRFGWSLDDLELGVRYSHEVTRPGQAGLGISGGRQQIARSDGSFWGVELAIQRVDDPVAPRSGLIFESALERGARTIRRRLVGPADDTMRVAVSDQRERMSVRLRGHIPVGAALSFVTGGEVSILTADDVDESDMFRLGGASSLRGYDEDRFRGTTTARGLLEIRSWFEERSFAAVFFDLGYVDRPAIRDIPAGSGWHPGFGVGASFTAPVGLMNVSYALSGSGGLREGRVHVGVRFGL